MPTVDAWALDQVWAGFGVGHGKLNYAARLDANWVSELDVRF